MDQDRTIFMETGLKGDVARLFRRFWSSLGLLSESRLALVGLIIFTIVMVIALIAPWLATHDPLHGDYLSINASSSRAHWLGTDNLGRDIYSRLVYGAQNAMLVAFIVVPLGMFVGVIIGGIPGYFGGKVDNIMMRFTDAALSFPGLIIFMAILAILGPGLWQVILALILGGTPSLVRFTRGLVLAERERDYVKAAKLIGENDLRILFRQVIPNVSSPLIVMATVRLGGTLLIFAGLTYLGLGPPPPEPSWGLMLNEARDLMETAPMVAVYPGLAIFVTVLGVNLLGDGLRDVLDPRLSEK
ncbi:MAG: ABC transporter permease [Deltaproteobacteria bacterium]|nr:ABC transporter permease [Deltaproteobacteria bacterium]MBW2086280.1 ABC transporter permease [Deltaproteobacteria bacterium]